MWRKENLIGDNYLDTSVLTEVVGSKTKLKASI